MNPHYLWSIERSGEGKRYERYFHFEKPATDRENAGGRRKRAQRGILARSALKNTSEDHTSKESTRNTFNSNTQEEKARKKNNSGESTGERGQYPGRRIHEGS